jgi:translation elongation factor EF-G
VASNGLRRRTAYSAGIVTLKQVKQLSSEWVINTWISIVEKLKRKFGAASGSLKLPKIPYKETIRKPGEGEGRYIKQTGGRGQYGIARIRIEPLEARVLDLSL